MKNWLPKRGQTFRSFGMQTAIAVSTSSIRPGIGNDAALRPNQIFAVSLPVSPLSPEQQKAVVDVCARRLLTSHGLRSLAPGEPGYTGHYGGSPRDRDAAYHQRHGLGLVAGTIRARTLSRLSRRKSPRFIISSRWAARFNSSGLGTLSEIFDGDAPFTPRGLYRPSLDGRGSIAGLDGNNERRKTSFQREAVDTAECQSLSAGR